MKRFTFIILSLMVSIIAWGQPKDNEFTLTVKNAEFLKYLKVTDKAEVIEKLSEYIVINNWVGTRNGNKILDYTINGNSLCIVANQPITELVVSGRGLFSGIRLSYISRFRTNMDLESITLPNSVTKVCTDREESWSYIGGSILYVPRTSSLNTIEFSNTTTKIEKGAFVECYGLTQLKNIVIPDSVTEIGDSAFAGRESLETIVVPNSVTKIGMGAFSGAGIKNIVIPDSVTEIGAGVFYNCESLESIIIPNSVTEIGESAFSCCESLKSITIPNSVTKIGKEAFSYTGIKNIVIPDSVTEIREEAFDGCESLETVVIPASVTKIGEDAFGYCPSLTKIFLNCETPPMLQSDYIFPEMGKDTIYIPKGCIGNYNSYPWTDWTIKEYDYDN